MATMEVKRTDLVRENILLSIVKLVKEGIG